MQANFLPHSTLAAGGRDCCRNGFSTALALILYILYYRKWNYYGIMSWHFSLVIAVYHIKQNGLKSEVTQSH